MKISNIANLPQPIVDAVSNDPYDDGGADISVTRLIAPPRQVALQKKHDGEIIEDASDRIWSLMGQLGHLVLQRAGGNIVVEKRFFASIGGWTISGQADVINGHTILDYKFTTVWSVKDGLKPEWEQQINLLAMLAGLNGVMITEGKIVTIFRDWSLLESKRNSDYPRQQVAVLDVPIWSAERIATFAIERIEAHQAAQNGHLPDCTALERWERPTKYAVMKKGNVRAVKLHDVDAEAAHHALSLGPMYSVVERPGESVRCLNYCNVSTFCTFAQGLATEPTP